VDEMMVKYTGRYAPIQQYLKGKPTQYGLKIWCLANSSSKYMQKIDMHCSATQSNQEGNVGSRNVLFLIEGLGGKGHIIMCDNYLVALTYLGNC
jgi:hypothetical protein